MPPIFPEEWFRMPEIRRRKLSAGIWIPLRQSEEINAGGDQWLPGRYEESLCVGTLAVYLDKRAIGDKLGWSDLGLSHTPGPYAFPDGRYKPSDQYWFNDDDPVGIELVQINRLNGDHPSEWLVNQDLIIALGLMREGDSWVRVDEGYLEVIRQRRNSEGRVVAIEIRAEHLRDYLCARGLALRLVQYRERLEIMADASHLPWHEHPIEEKTPNERLELRVIQIDESGGRYGGRVGVFRVRRTDVDHAIDVPEFGPETDANTASEQYEFERGGTPSNRVEGAFWREECVEPAACSERVRGDTPEEQLYFAVGAAGEKAPANKLDYEDVGIYLWFSAEVIEALLAYRGAALDWYSDATGQVRCSPDYSVHFGINAANRINVYAYDIARLPLWQQRIWHGFNVSPDGSPSQELQAAQFACQPADTRAPEAAFTQLLQQLDELFTDRFGAPLFKPHEHTLRIIRACHRFRALKEHGILTLAKDVARVTADSIDIGLLLKLAPLGPKENKLGGLKMLERVLQQYVDAAEAYRIMGPLHIAYGLRLGDAHLPSSDLAQALKDLGASAATHPLEMGRALLARVCDALNDIGAAIANGKPTTPEAAKQAAQA